MLAGKYFNDYCPSCGTANCNRYLDPMIRLRYRKTQIFIVKIFSDSLAYVKIRCMKTYVHY